MNGDGEDLRVCVLKHSPNELGDVTHEVIVNEVLRTHIDSSTFESGLLTCGANAMSSTIICISLSRKRNSVRMQWSADQRQGYANDSYPISAYGALSRAVCLLSATVFWSGDVHEPQANSQDKLNKRCLVFQRRSFAKSFCVAVAMEATRRYCSSDEQV
jgi:hypothetical protein